VDLREVNEEEFPRFAKSYFSEAFPNPRRLDCSPDADLVGLAEHPRKPIRLFLNTSPAVPSASTAIWRFSLT